MNLLNLDSRAFPIDHMMRDSVIFAGKLEKITTVLHCMMLATKPNVILDLLILKIL